MESINVSFHDKKITALEDFDDHDQVRFENEHLNSDSGNSDDLNPDLVSSTGLSSYVIETVVTTPKENAPVQGEQAEDPTTSQDSREASDLVTDSSSSDSSSSDEPSTDNFGSSDSSTPEKSNSNSEISESITKGRASENADGDSMDHGGGSSSRDQLPSARKWTKAHTPDLIIGDPEAGVRTRTATLNECLYHSFLSQTEPKKVEEAFQDADWVQAMQEELNEFERNKVWTLVPRPKNRSVVGTKWELEELDKEKERFFASKMKEMESFKAEEAKFAEKSGKEMQELKNHTEQVYFNVSLAILECDVYGTVDYIFGNTTVVLQNCNLYPRLAMQGQFNAITAQGRTDINQNTWTSIQNCTIKEAESLWPNKPPELKGVVEAYSIEIGNVSRRHSGSLSVKMGMDSNDLPELHKEMQISMRVNYYPVCCEPEKVMGMSPHSDATTITILLQDNNINYTFT
ncbi:hypothetical protein AgCh_012272 [Apium graveolens]